MTALVLLVLGAATAADDAPLAPRLAICSGVGPVSLTGGVTRFPSSSPPPGVAAPAGSAHAYDGMTLLWPFGLEWAADEVAGSLALQIGRGDGLGSTIAGRAGNWPERYESRTAGGTLDLVLVRRHEVWLSLGGAAEYWHFGQEYETACGGYASPGMDRETLRGSFVRVGAALRARFRAERRSSFRLAFTVLPWGAGWGTRGGTCASAAPERYEARAASTTLVLEAGFVLRVSDRVALAMDIGSATRTFEMTRRDGTVAAAGRQWTASVFPRLTAQAWL